MSYNPVCELDILNQYWTLNMCNTRLHLFSSENGEVNSYRWYSAYYI